MTSSIRKATNTFNEYQLMVKSLQQANPLLNREEVTERFGFVGDALIMEICRLMKWDSEENDTFGIIWQWMIHMDDGDFETMRLIVEEVAE